MKTRDHSRIPPFQGLMVFRLFCTGLHPVLTDDALAGLEELSIDRVGSDRMDITFSNPKLELIKSENNLQTMSLLFTFAIIEKTQLNQLFDRTDLNKLTQEFSNHLILFE